MNKDKDLENEFATLLSEEEYNRLIDKYKDKPSNTQTNYYFDTPRFTLKASDIGLRIRKKEKYELTYKCKKGYQIQEITYVMTEEEAKLMIEEGICPSKEINQELQSTIKEQKLVNYMYLSTYRVYFSYARGHAAIDKCTYVNKTDFELIYSATSREQAKKEFVELVKGLKVTYKKSQAKILRAYEALRRTM
jgi:uncharacterized protein YjbK